MGMLQSPDICGIQKARKKAWERKVDTGLSAIWDNVGVDRIIDEVDWRIGQPQVRSRRDGGDGTLMSGN